MLVLPQDLTSWNSSQLSMIDKYGIFMNLDEKPSHFTIHLSKRSEGSIFGAAVAEYHSRVSKKNIYIFESGGKQSYVSLLAKYSSLVKKSEHAFVNSTTDSLITVVSSIFECEGCAVDVLIVDFATDGTCRFLHTSRPLLIPVTDHAVQLVSNINLE